jgi:alanyl-tRNA synthetase
MNKLSYIEIRQKYLDFFKSKDHEEIPSASLVPENDPSVLFVNAGMFPLIPYLMGETHPKGKRLVNVQRCLRTVDFENVGDKEHCTTFEMLGNWSLNDYFKKEAINLTVEFFVKELGIDMNRIYASVFKGEGEIPQDEESINIWKEIFSNYGIDAKVGPDERIRTLGKEDNWWGLVSGGPCGPDSEIFYKMDDGQLVEIGNNVFMEYLLENGEYKPLGKHNVDFGGGLDRLVMISQGVDSVFETDIYKPIFEKVKSLNNVHDIRSERIITDHIKAATWVIMDGVIPGRNERGYILRRLIRRAVRHAKLLNIKDLFTREVAGIAVDQFSVIYPKLKEDKERILDIIEEEEKKFNKTIESGIRELQKIINKEEDITGKKAFMIYETYGFPIEMTIEELENQNFKFDKVKLEEDFKKAFDQHKEQSRTASAGLFKGGLADTSEMSTKYHTATHLLLEALRQILGDQVIQRGSNINPDRLRFDYNSDQKLTTEQVKEVEDIVNKQIEKDLPVTFKMLPKEEALKIVKGAAFAEKYGDEVKVYYIGPEDNPFSVEICGGPHVENTKDLGHFRIIKQENVGAGIKRIKGVLE